MDDPLNWSADDQERALRAIAPWYDLDFGSLTEDVEMLLELSSPGQRVLELGAGSGRIATPLALHDRRVTAVDSSEAMLEVGRARMREAGVPIALASSSHREWVEAALTGAGLREYFEQTTAGDEVSMGKPSPEIYLKAAEKLGFDPADCIAIEDAPAGVESANAAGMRVVLVRSELTNDMDLASDWQVDDLTEFNLTWLSERSTKLVGAV